MPNLAIPRSQVHRLAEACSDAGDAFQPTATRLIRRQRRLSRFFEQNMTEMGPVPGQISLYMLSVVLRIFEQVGGRVKKVTGRELDQATARVQQQLGDLFPADDEFATRARAIESRAQPHILDEVLWALYEEHEDTEEASIEADQSALIYVMLWTAVEALDDVWSPPKGWVPETDPEADPS